MSCSNVGRVLASEAGPSILDIQLNGMMAKGPSDAFRRRRICMDIESPLMMPDNRIQALPRIAIPGNRRRRAGGTGGIVH